LEPERGVFSTNITKSSYPVSLKETLFESLSPSPFIRIVFESSTQPEYVLSIDKVNDRYILTYVGLCNNIGELWVDYEDVTISSYNLNKSKIELGLLLTQKISKLLTLATSHVSYPSIPNDFKDTIIYTYIIAVETSVRSGKTSLTNVDSKLKGLVEITEWLRECAMKEKILEANIYGKKIDELIKQFK
jgi:hypothetical protein